MISLDSSRETGPAPSAHPRRAEPGPWWQAMARAYLTAGDLLMLRVLMRDVVEAEFTEAGIDYPRDWWLVTRS